MFIITAMGGVMLGDIIVQLIFFAVLIAIVVGVIFLFVMFNKKNKRLNEVEQKIDKLEKKLWKVEISKLVLSCKSYSTLIH